MVDNCDGMTPLPDVIINDTMRTTTMTIIVIIRRKNNEHRLRNWNNRGMMKVVTDAGRRERWNCHANEQSRHPYLTSSSTYRDIADSQEQIVDLIIGVLWEQLSMNRELMWQCNELEKLLNKQQPSPTWDHYQSPKQYHDSRAMVDHCRWEDEIDEFLKGDGDFPSHRRS